MSDVVGRAGPIAPETFNEETDGGYICWRPARDQRSVRGRGRWRCGWWRWWCRGCKYRHWGRRRFDVRCRRRFEYEWWCKLQSWCNHTAGIDTGAGDSWRWNRSEHRHDRHRHWHRCEYSDARHRIDPEHSGNIGNRVDDDRTKSRTIDQSYQHVAAEFDAGQRKHTIRTPRTIGSPCRWLTPARVCPADMPGIPERARRVAAFQ